jgi:tetrahydromethanopterin S-methyltransferase subunit C
MSLTRTEAAVVVGGSTALAAKFVFDKSPKQVILWGVIGAVLIVAALSIKTPSLETAAPTARPTR